MKPSSNKVQLTFAWFSDEQLALLADQFCLCNDTVPRLVRILRELRTAQEEDPLIDCVSSGFESLVQYTLWRTLETRGYIDAEHCLVLDALKQKPQLSPGPQS